MQQAAFLFRALDFMHSNFSAVVPVTAIFEE